MEELKAYIKKVNNQEFLMKDDFNEIGRMTEGLTPQEALDMVRTKWFKTFSKKHGKSVEEWRWKSDRRAKLE